MSKAVPMQINRKPNLSLWWITALLIAINVGLYIAQVISGVDAANPSTLDAIRWGADFSPLTLLEQPSRLFTSMFFHFGFAHLALNMWALYIFGSISEQIFGRMYYIGVYLFSGLMGSLLSSYITIENSYALLQHFDPKLLPHISAGASGAVMGLGAALTLLSLFPASAQQQFILDKKSLLIVMAINLIFGFSVSGINNAAHMGGIVMGALMALTWYVGQKFARPQLALILTLAACILLCIGFYLYCMQLIVPVTPLWQAMLAQL